MKYKSRFLFCFLSVLATVLLSATVYPQAIGDRNRPAASGGGSGSHAVTGRVSYPDGRPAGGITVTINGFGFGSNRTVTDENGGFSFRDLPKGTYTLDATADGYENARDSIAIESYASRNQGFVVMLHFRLPGQAKGAKPPPNPLLAGIPREPLAKYEQALEKLRKNDPKGALILLDEALALHPNFAAAAYEKGSVLLKQNEPDKALEAFVKAISIKPDYTEAKYSVGYTQFLKKNYEVAAAIFDDVLKLKADMNEARMYLGISLFYLKNSDAAEASLQKTISAPGGDRLALAHLYLGQIYVQKKKNAEAAAELEKYLELVPKAPNAERLKSTIADLRKKT